ncbi:MAG: hypothetical protein P4L45_13060 [Ignavibacteriaceae bacterium]|nr:hypothetical protein [Ignavibacteriaceae bacterium]
MNIKYSVSREIMRDTKEFLLSQGKKDKEAFVLWKGKRVSENQFDVTGMIIPNQTAVRTQFGYSFDISEQSIIEVLKELRLSNEIGLIQVHSHPGHSTMHSDRDDKLSLLGRKGSLSIVLPYFGNAAFEDFSSAKVHILTGINKWEALTLQQVNDVLSVKR